MSSICPSVIVVLVIAALGIYVFLWLKGVARMRIILLLVMILCIGVAAWFLGGPQRSDRWNSLMSVATLLAVVVALFLDDIRTLIHRPKIEVNVAFDLIEFAHGKYYIRGTVKNTGDRRAKRCRVKLLRVEGQDYEMQQINAYLEWQGNTREFLTLCPDEHWIFDIGKRDPAEAAPFPLRFSTYIGGNDVARELAPRNLSYRLILVVYGDNIPSKRQPVSLTLGAAANDVQISLGA